MNSQYLPTCLALVFSDHIHICPSTHKRTILGTFSAVFAEKFPAKINLAVYCAITDGLGEIEVELRLVRLDPASYDDIEVASAKGRVDFTDPRTVIEMNMFFPGLELKMPGEYRLQVIAEEEILLERRLVAIQPKSELEVEEEA